MTGRPDDRPVERTLDDLFDRLAGTGAAGRRALAEAEDHLRSATAEGVAGGLSERDAEVAAVARFGSTSQVAAGLRSVHIGPSAWLRPAFVGCWLAGGVGLVAVGVSGLLSELFGQVYGPAFVAGDASGVAYTTDRCAEYFEYAPNAVSCAAAAAEHHWGEVVTGRVAVGVLGLLALLVLWVARRRGPLAGPAWTPARLAVAVPLTAAFTLVGLLFTGLSVMQLSVHDTDMVGANLATGVVSLLAAAMVVLAARAVGRQSLRRIR